MLIFFYLLKQKEYLFLQDRLLNNTFKIIISSIIMVLMLITVLEKYSSYIEYAYTYKAICLLIIVGSMGIVYLLSCYLLGLLKVKNYRTN